MDRNPQGVIAGQPAGQRFVLTCKKNTFDRARLEPDEFWVVFSRLEDPQKPIFCPHQEEDMDRSPSVNVPSAAVLEISENLRAKIYSIFCKLGNYT